MPHEKIEQIITDFGDLTDDLLALLDDLWLEIDHTNAESIRKGSEKMIDFVSSVKDFQHLRDDIQAKLRGFLPPPEEQPSQPVDQKIKEEMARFDGKEIISLNNYWSYKRPFGFILFGMPYPWRTTWIDLYENFCYALRERDAPRFDSIPDRREIISTQGNPYFSRDSSRLRSPLNVAEGIYAESNLSANLIRDNIQRLLRIFEIPEEELKIYLR